MTHINQIWVVLLIGWSKFQPIRSTTQIYVVSVHQYGILRSFLRCHFAGKPVVAWRNVGCFLRLTNSVNVVMVIRVFKLKEQDWVFRFNFFGQNDGKPCLGTMERSQGKFLSRTMNIFIWIYEDSFAKKRNPITLARKLSSCVTQKISKKRGFYQPRFDSGKYFECVSKSHNIVRGEEVLKTNVETASYATLKKKRRVLRRLVLRDWEHWNLADL